MSRRQGVHRRALAVAVRNADWLEPKGADAAALQACRELADQLDRLHAVDTSLFAGNANPLEASGRFSYHVANTAAKYLTALEALRLTNAARPELEDDDGGLVTALKAVVDDATQ